MACATLACVCIDPVTILAWLTSSGVENAFYFHFYTTVQTQNFLVLLKVCPHHTDMILDPCSEPFLRKDTNNFHQAENRVYPPSSGDSLLKCRSCMYIVLANWKTNPKEAFICSKEKTKNIQDSVHVALQWEFCSQAGVRTKYEITPGMV